MRSQNQALTYQKVTKENLPLALNIQHATWPNEFPDNDYLEKLSYPEDKHNVSWIIYHNETPIGITGVFAFDPDEPGYDNNESIWVDWFAILPKFRRQHFGQQVLLDIINYCQQLGQYKYLRLDTIYYTGRPAIFLYDKIMQLREEYTAEDIADKQQNYLIYSYSLDGSKIKPWNNRFLNLGDSEGDIVI